MDENKILYNALNIYYNTLKNLGNIPYNEVNKIILYDFLQQIQTDNLSYYLTEDDIKTINNILSSYIGTSCLFPYPSNCKSNKVTENTVNYFYYGASSTEDISSSDILLGTKFRDYNYITEALLNTTIWIAIPYSNTITSIQNIAAFNEEWLDNFSISTVTVNNISYKLYRCTGVRAISGTFLIKIK